MTPALNIAGLGITLGGHRVLHDIHLQFAAGDFVALVGPNGAGKSTLLRCCAGVLAGTTGTVRIAGHDLADDPVAARTQLGMSVDPTALPALLTDHEALALWARGRGLDAVPSATLALAEAWRLGPMLPRYIAHYSLGTRQKLGILLGLMDAPPVLLLDEPLNGLDPRSALALKVELQRRADGGACILLAMHALEAAERFVNRALLLVDGCVAAEWSRDQIAAIRDDSARSLEASIGGCDAVRRPDQASHLVPGVRFGDYRSVDPPPRKGTEMQKRKETRVAMAAIACLVGAGIMGIAVAQDLPDRGLGSCEGKTVAGWIGRHRVETINDVQQSWVGAELSELVASRGAPSSTFENKDGTRILTWANNSWGNCKQTYEVDAQDIVTRWNNSNCYCSNGERPRRMPKSTPIPRMTL